MNSDINKDHPRQKANFLSRFVHGWIFKLLRKSRKRTINLDDLYPLLPEFEAERLTDKLEKHWNNERERNPRYPSLLRATLRTMGWTPFLAGLLLIPKGIATILQAILIIILMDFFGPCPTYSVSFAYGIGGATVLCSFVTSLCYHPYYYAMQMNGLRMKVAYIGLIYRKMLRLSNNSIATQGSGKINTLVSSDAEQIDLAAHFFHYLWIAPLELLAISIVFWHFVRQLSLIAIGYTILLIFSQLGFGELFVHFRTRILRFTDERMRITSEAFRSMRVVKMYCWESPFKGKIISVRHREIIQCAYRLLLDCVQTFFSHTHLTITMLMIYLAMWSLNIRFDTRLFAILMCLVGYMRMWTIDTSNYGVRNLVHYFAARRRIQEFLLLPESKAAEKSKEKSTKSAYLSCNIDVAVWNEEPSFALKNIILEAKPGDLILIIGTVGSGKSSLLQALLGEMTRCEGKIEYSGDMCYVPQESWLYSATIRENILFGKENNNELLQEILRITELQYDINRMQDNLNTPVGDQGAMLSGGQKARVNLARALYQNGDIYLMDDPFSALDVNVGTAIFNNVIRGYLRDKICVLVTHQTLFLQNATKIIVLENGTIEHTGTFEELLLKPQFQRRLDEIRHHQPAQLGQIPGISGTAHTPGPAENADNEDAALIAQDAREKGIVSPSVYFKFVRAGVGIIGGMILPIIFCIHQGLGMFNNWWLASWSQSEGLRHGLIKTCQNETTTTQNIWTEMTDLEWETYRNQRFFIYCGLTGAFIFITIIRVITTEFMCLNASRVLHNKMLGRILQCPMSFFDKTPIGQILNRFSKDIGIIDDTLPLILFEFLQTFFQIIGTMILVGWFNPWSFLTTLVAIMGMLFVRQHLAPCSLDLKRLESVTRTPFYSYLMSSYQGTKIIRSYRLQDFCSRRFLTYINENTSVNFLLCTINRWAAFRFDWLTGFFIGCVTVLSVFMHTLRDQLSPVDIALTLSYSLNLMGLLQWSIRLSVEVETMMTAPERISAYDKVEQEPVASSSKAAQNEIKDSEAYSIEFKDVTMHYSLRNNDFTALTDVSIFVRPGEKIGIVGRTGAGKSTLLQTLYRLYPIDSGRILIGSTDIKDMDLKTLRGTISAIPQDPVLFTDTLRANLDPFNRYADAELWEALELVQLTNFVREHLQGGLDAKIDEGGTNLNVGTKQLICLARAVLKNSKILLIDEATAGIDIETANLVQKTIEKRFQQSTVLTIAHRLPTILNCDRILVLERGRVSEFDKPHVLMDNPDSFLNKLMRELEQTN